MWESTSTIQVHGRPWFFVAGAADSKSFAVKTVGGFMATDSLAGLDVELRPHLGQQRK
jgi:hypothetical protein